MTRALCSAKLRNGDPCRSAATDGEFCAYHAAVATELGSEAAWNGSHSKKRNARRRVPLTAESEPLELNSNPPSSPSAVRPALALTAAEEVETIRRVLLEAATSTSRETWATCTCPEWRSSAVEKPRFVQNSRAGNGSSAKRSLVSSPRSAEAARDLTTI